MEPESRVETDCPSCAALYSRGSKQQVWCCHGGQCQKFWFCMTPDEVSAYHKELKTNEGDNNCLHQLMKRAAGNFSPELPVAHQCDVEYFAAGSWVREKLRCVSIYRDGDMIVAPLKKLMEDYDPKKYRFYTTHRGIATDEARSVNTLWVDEFTLFDYRALCIILFSTSSPNGLSLLATSNRCTSRGCMVGPSPQTSRTTPNALNPVISGQRFPAKNSL